MDEATARRAAETNLSRLSSQSASDAKLRRVEEENKILTNINHSNDKDKEILTAKLQVGINE